MAHTNYWKGKIAAGLACAMLLPLLCGCQQSPSQPTEGETTAVTTTAAPTETVVETTVPTEPLVTTPADGNPKDVTAKGTYTAREDQKDPEGVVAVMGVPKTEPTETTVPEESVAPTEAPMETEPATEVATEPTEASTAPTEPEEILPTEAPEMETEHARLTNEQLQVYYWMEVLEFKQAGHENGPDFTQPLDVQICQIDDTVNSWQQYFLREALATWVKDQSLILWGQLEGIPLDDEYLIREDQHKEHLSHDLPASKLLYGYNGTTYRPNTMHQAFLDNLPAMAEEMAKKAGLPAAFSLASNLFGTSTDGLVAYMENYNRAYMFLTELGYYMEEITPEEVETYFTAHEAEYAAKGITRESGKYVDMRHILLHPANAEVAEDGTVTAPDKDWRDLDYIAAKLMKKIKGTYPQTEGVFATFAANNSLDAGSAMNGGGYVNITKGQLIPELDAWFFDETRKEGDKDIIRTALGAHLVYFSGSEDIWAAEARQDLIAEKYQKLIDAAVAKYVTEIDYSRIRLVDAAQTCPAITADEMLYQDLAHERFPEAPLYLQQDYQKTKYGAYNVATYGCGITTLAMLTTYHSDKEYTVPTMCGMFGTYCSDKGTNRAIFIYETGDLGLYVKEQIYDLNKVYTALEEGCIVVNLQHDSYWTRGGHFLLLEKLKDNGNVVVRDSNILNYSKLSGHAIDEHEFKTLKGGNVTNWIFWPKYVRCSQCIRCADGTTAAAPGALFNSEYQCEKCDAALLRRSAYLNR